MTFKIGIFDKYMHKVVFYIKNRNTKCKYIFYSVTQKILLSEHYIVFRNIYIYIYKFLFLVPFPTYILYTTIFLFKQGMKYNDDMDYPISTFNMYILYSSNSVRLELYNIPFPGRIQAHTSTLKGRSFKNLNPVKNVL